MNLRPQGMAPGKGWVASSAMVLVLSATPALAGDACTGTYTTTQMRTVPLPLIISLAQEPENEKLAARFLDGFRDGGGRIDSGSPMKMTLLFTLSTAGGAQVYNNFTWADSKGEAINVKAGSLQMTAKVMEANTYAYVWAISASCNIRVPSAGAVAYELGQIIGRTLGRAVQNGML